jgi:quercetin 2,3-dioxygenase
MQKPVLRIQRKRPQHWVGNGFPVQSLLFYGEGGEQISPFLLLDYAGPAQFPPTPERLGVGEHPHRGFETVTIVYDGQVEHRDSSGASGTIDAGGVQWMTAGAGVVHEEFHGRHFAQRGGRFEMVQLWVNLPAKHKMTTPKYQEIQASQIPTVTIEHGTLRVIAGEFQSTTGAASTFSPVNVWDVRLTHGTTSFEVPDGHTLALACLEGELSLGSGERLIAGEISVHAPAGTTISVTTSAPTKLLILSGQPLNEPIAGYGPFVMNTRAELQQAFHDFQSGKMGRLP